MYFGHVAMYTPDVQRMADFYVKYFGGKIFWDNTGYGMHSIYVGFDEHCYLELMQKPEIEASAYKPGEEREGLTHIAINAESSARVRELTAQLEKDGYTVLLQPTDYGTDIFYESCILDPDGNRVEICVHADVLKAEHEAAQAK